MRVSHWAFCGALLMVVSVLSACGQQTGGLPMAPAVSARANASPPACKGQATKKNDATVADDLNGAGGSFCVPGFAGFGGDIAYPIFYLEFKIGEVSFGTTLGSGGGLTSSAIKAGQPYTAFGAAIIDSEKIVLGPCYTVATKGKYGGVIGGLGSLVEGRTVFSTATGVIEIYPCSDRMSRNCPPASVASGVEAARSFAERVASNGPIRQ